MWVITYGVEIINYNSSTQVSRKAWMCINKMKENFKYFKFQH